MSDRVEQVKETIARLETSWNDSNAYLWASAFTDPCDYIDTSGKLHTEWSRIQNAKLLHTGWETTYHQSHASFHVEKIEFPSDNICVAILQGHIEYELNGERHSLSNMVTCVLIKHGPEWLIRNYHNTAIRKI